MKRWICCLLLSVCAVAQQDEKRGDVIQGSVVDATTGEPIRKAVVILTPRQGSGRVLQTITDLEGKFRLHGVEAGAYFLYPQKNGWVPAEGSPEEVSVSGSQPMPKQTIKLKPAGAVSGRVIDPDGDPATSAHLILLPARKRGSSNRSTQRGWAQTDDRGQYRLHSIPPGRYRVLATPAQSLNQGRAQIQRPESGAQTEEAQAPTYYPSALEEMQGAVVQVESGQEAQGIDIQLARSRALRIKGRVAGMPSGPNHRAVVNIGRASDMYGGPSTTIPATADKAEFEASGLIPGAYTVMVRTGSPDGTSLVGFADVQVGDVDVENLVVEVHPTATLQGRLQFPEGKEPSGMALYLEPKSIRWGFGGSPAKVEADGSFKFPQLLSGEYFVRFFNAGGAADSASQDLWIASIMQGSTEVLDTGVKVGPSGAEPIVIRFDTGPGSVSSSVKDEKQEPVRGATVALLRAKATPSSQRPLMCQTDSTGSCKIGSLPPGDYRAYAFIGFDGSDLMDPELYGEFEKQAKELKIGKSESAAIELKGIRLE